MGPIGFPEAVFIFFLAFLLFGPKKLPELGRTVGKAFADFQRAKGQLQEAFDRETKQLGLGLDTESLSSFVSGYWVENKTPLPAIDASSSASAYEGLYGSEAYVSSAIRIPEPKADEAELHALLPEGAATRVSEDFSETDSGY
jgi:sec-independent protein translocase protein TatA